MAEPTKLRIGILCESLQMPRWQAECLRHIKAVPGVELALVITRGAQGDGARIPHGWNTFLYRRWLDGKGRPPAMVAVDAGPLLGGAQKMECSTELRNGAELFSASDIEKIRSHAPDILLRFGLNNMRGELLQLPRFGAWSFHHGDELKYRGGPPGFWELMHGDPVTGAVLQRLSQQPDGGRVLRKGWFRTIDHSLKETVDTVLMHSAIWPAQVCREILAGNEQAAEGHPGDTSAPIFKYPGNTDFLRFLWKLFRNKARFHRDEPDHHEEWNIGVLHQPIASLLDEKPSLNVRWLPPPNIGQFRADAFGYMMDGHLNAIYEKYDRSTAKGTIARVRPKRDNILKRSRNLLDTDRHLAYPFTLMCGGIVHVVPEQASAGKVELYRLAPDNGSLIPVCTLLEEPLIGPTLFQYEGRWWLFGTKAPLANVELFAFHSERLEGPYRPHALNPVKSDIRSARPGGTPFMHDDVLWRPAQDCSRTIGGRIALNRVHALSPETFAEETVKYIAPLAGPWSKGMRTLAAAGAVTLVDGRRYLTDKQQHERARKHKAERVKAHKRRQAREVESDDDEDEYGD